MEHERTETDGWMSAIDTFRALFKMRNKLFGLLPVLQPASKGGVLPLFPTPFPPPP